MEVRSFKLIGGMELIAELVVESATSFTIRRPLVVMPTRSKTGELGIDFGMWSFIHNEEDIVLYSHALISRPIGVLAEVARTYVQNVTGLSLPSSGGSQLITG